MNNRLSINGIMKIANLCLLIVLENYALDYGMGFLTASYILVAWLYMILMGNVANAMTKMVVSRVNNGLYGNAKKIFRCLMGYTAFISIISFFIKEENCQTFHFFFPDLFPGGYCFCQCVWGCLYQPTPEAVWHSLFTGCSFRYVKRILSWYDRKYKAF